MAKKNKKKAKKGKRRMESAGISLTRSAAAGVMGGVLAEALSGLIEHYAYDFLNKNGKKKARQMLKRLTSPLQS